MVCIVAATMKQQDHYEGALLEDMQSDIKLILEVVIPLAGLPAQLRKVDERLQIVEADVKIIKKVVTAHSKQLNNHETRILALEAS